MATPFEQISMMNVPGFCSFNVTTYHLNLKELMSGHFFGSVQKMAGRKILLEARP